MLTDHLAEFTSARSVTWAFTRPEIYGDNTRHELNPRDPLRLGREDPGTEDWYRYDSGNTLESVAQAVVRQIDITEKWWAG
jgi:hypothetical protein